MFKNIDDYIAKQPEEVQHILEKIRQTIKDAAPKATETISYTMPAFKMGKTLVYFAYCKTHLGFYPMPSGIEAFSKELARYKTSKGAIQFPWNQPIPYDLIRKITLYRVEQVVSEK